MREMDKRKLLAEIESDEFAKLNGAIIRTVNMLGPGWHKVSDICPAFRDKSEAELFSSLDYLQALGAIQIQDRETKTLVDVTEFELSEVNIRLSATGIKLLRCVTNDELILM